MRRTPPGLAPLKLFYSYARADKADLQTLRRYVRPLEHEGLLVTWYDELIEAGRAWTPELRAQLLGADIILLLVSANFLASNYCMTIELPLAMERHEQGETRVIPILLRESDWQRHTFARLQALPSDGRSVEAWPGPAAGWTHVVQALRGIVDSLASSRLAAKGGAELDVEGAGTATSGGRPVLPVRGHCFGREAIVRALVATVLESGPRPITVLGPPGIGKSTVTIEALHAPEAIGRFGNRRFFVRLDGATTADSMLSTLAATLGIRPTSGQWPQVRGTLEEAPALLVLDNAETAWEADRREVEALLGQLAAIPSVALIVSVRGEARPLLPNQASPIVVPPLGEEAACQLFCSIAWHVSPEEPSLSALLEVHDGLPLAISLLAHAAEGVELSVLAKLWEARRSELMERADAADRLSSLAVSFSLSIQSPRMTEEAHRLNSVLACLPEGMALDDVESLVPRSGLAGASTLCKVGLAFMEAGRLRQLSPIREHVRRFYPPASEERERTVDYYLRLAKEKGEKVGRQEGASAVAWLVDEMGNVDEVIRMGLEGSRVEQAIDTLLALTHFMETSGAGSPRLMIQAGEAAQHREDWRRTTECMASLGKVLSARSLYEESSYYFEQALSSFEEVGASHGQARCHQGLAEIALRQARHEEARTHIEAARLLYHHIGDVNGEGICTYQLGESALRRSLSGDAYSYFERARHLFRQAGALQGEANSIRSMGELHLRNMRNAEARPLLQEAMRLFQQVGDIRGEANCIKNLGELSFNMGEYEQARAFFEQALPVYEQVSSVNGYAVCLMFLGMIEQRNSRFEQALPYFDEAVGLFQQIDNLLGQGTCHLAFGEIAEARENFEEALVLYRQALGFYSRIPDPNMVRRAQHHLLMLELKLRGGMF